MNEKSDIGGVFVAPEVIVTYISSAVTDTQGVADLAGNISDTITKKILGNESKFKGIKIDGGENGYTVDIYIIVKYGERIPDVAWNVQKNVKASLDGVMDIAVENINIHVQGVRKEDTEGAGVEPEADGGDVK
ncbi:MAG: Asp23/Gls24 family envelope stress response protein [Clostridiales Family XIII bacterium]|nr:Asp23/Gls24 family envelope stress response protein [Clostridiales Family XIII bacterium]